MSKLGGYVGRVLFVDLSNGRLTEEIPEESLLRSFIGGYGTGARILYDGMAAGVDPLGPESILGFVTGPLTGTPAPMSGRYCVVGKSPLTGGWGDANSGGEFGPYLKFAGYDAVYIHGASDCPTYLFLDGGAALLRPAEDLWGLDTIETEDVLRTRHGRDSRVACIGPAGENRSLIACIINDRGRAAARSGLGAVMGAKRLKAVVVRGDRAPRVANAEGLEEIRRDLFPRFRVEGSWSETLAAQGTPALIDRLVEIGRTPIRNWAGAYPDDFPNPEAVGAEAFLAYSKRKYACWHCHVGCGALVEWESDSGTVQGHRPEYETIATCGTYCGISDPVVIMDLNEMCNRAGLDTISAGATVAFAMECHENGLLSANDLRGLTPEWGNGEAAKAILGQMIRREGIGELLADGTRVASCRLGKGSERFAIQSGGQELPAHDPRQFAAMGLMYEISPTPGKHMQGGASVETASPASLADFGLPQLTAEMRTEQPLAYGGVGYRALTAWVNVLNAAGLCSFSSGSGCRQYLPDLIAAVVGWDFDMKECLQAGERIEVLRYLFCRREGYNPMENRVAARAMGDPPLSSGPNAGVRVEVEALREAYLLEMDWDPRTDLPSRRRLATLGLDDLQSDFPEG